MAKKFSDICVVPYNGMFLIQNALRPIMWELERGGGRYSEVDGTIFWKSHVIFWKTHIMGI